MRELVIGDDHVLNFTLSNDGTAIDLDDAAEIEVKLYQKKNVILADYTLTGGAVDIVVANDGTCKVNVDRSSFLSVPPGILYCQITVSMDNVDFEFNRKVSSLTDIILGELVTAV